MRRRRVLAGPRFGPLILLVAACAGPDTPTDLPLRTLEPYGASIVETFTSVNGGLLTGGTLFLADPAEKKVLAVNLRDGTSRKLGREGTGPGEYRSPRAVLPWRGDSLVVWDDRTRAYTVWSRDLTVIASDRYSFLEISAPPGTRTYLAVDQHGAAAFRFDVPPTHTLIAAHDETLVFTERDELDVLKLRAYRAQTP